MRDAWIMRLFSRERLDAASASKQIASFGSVSGGVLLPDKWGGYEPVRTQFSLDGLDEPVQSLISPLGSVYSPKASQNEWRFPFGTAVSRQVLGSLILRFLRTGSGLSIGPGWLAQAGLDLVTAFISSFGLLTQTSVR